MLPSAGQDVMFAAGSSDPTPMAGTQGHALLSRQRNETAHTSMMPRVGGYHKIWHGVLREVRILHFLFNKRAQIRESFPGDLPPVGAPMGAMLATQGQGSIPTAFWSQPLRELPSWVLDLLLNVVALGE